MKAGLVDWLTSQKFLFEKLYIAHLSNLGMFATSFERLAGEAPRLKLHRHSRFLRLHDLQPLTFSKHVKSISFEHVILKSCQDLVKQLLHVKRLPCRGVQVINHGSSRSSRIARQNLLSIVTFCTFQRLWRRSDGKERNYNAETGKLRHYFQVWALLRTDCRALSPSILENPVPEWRPLWRHGNNKLQEYTSNGRDEVKNY